MGSARASGHRLSYDRLPPTVTNWVELSLGGRVEQVQPCTGGMSPGCAARLRLADGGRAFVKAVGAEQNQRSYELYQQEMAPLAALPLVAHRPTLLGSYDTDGWAALLLEDLAGGELDLDRPADFADAAEVVDRQAAELTPAPSGTAVPRLDDTALTWLESWTGDIMAEPSHFLPGWTVAVVEHLDDRVRALPARLSGSTLCHWDIRGDNLLRRGDGTVVVCDWGMAHTGVWWGDRFQLATRHAGQPLIDDWLSGRSGWSADLDADLTSLLVLFGARHAWLAAQPAAPGLPTMAAFRRARAADMLAGARRRLARP